MNRKTRWLAGVYLLILCVIVFLADQKRFQFLFKFIRETPYADKVGHFFLMGGFSFILNMAMNCATMKVWRFRLLKGSLIVALIVTLEEFSQLFIRYRTFDLIDLTCDYLGIFLFARLALYLTNRRLAHSK